MSTANRWYCTRESCKAALGIQGADLDALLDANIEAATDSVEKWLSMRFIPYAATKYFRWPQTTPEGYILSLNEPLLAATALTKDDDTATAIDAADYFLEPANSGPPYYSIEIDLASSAYFGYAATPQRAVRVTGRWGYSEDTKPAGALAEDLDASETGVDVTDASLIGVGDTLLCGTEAMFVSGRSALTTATTLSGNPTADDSDVSIGVVDGTKVKAGEVILVDSERMLVTDVVSNTLTVKRAYDGSLLVAHTSTTTVYAYRTLTVVRGVNGTTAAIHSSAAALTKYAPPALIVELCRAYAMHNHEQDRTGWTGQLGGGEGALTMSPGSLAALEKEVWNRYIGIVVA